MAVDYISRPGTTYRDHLASHSVKESIDIVLSKPIRSAIGPLDDMLKNGGQALRNALRDLIWFRSGPNENVEIVRLNLWDVCAGPDRAAFDTVSGFQSLFVQPDEQGPELTHLTALRMIGTAPPPTEDGGVDACTTALSLMESQLYRQALQTLEQAAGDAADWRSCYLQGVLLAGIPGQPRSAEMLDFSGAERAFATAAQRTPPGHGPLAAHCLTAAGKAAYAGGRPADAKRRLEAALARDPNCAEAHYQLARLALELDHGKAAIIRTRLSRAIDLHWSYGLRAAADPSLAARHALVRRCLMRAARGMVRDARTGCAEAANRLRFLNKQSRFYAFTEPAAFQALAGKAARLEGTIWADALKRAFEIRKTVRALNKSIDAFTATYCAALRSNAAAIIERGCTYRRRRNVQPLASRLAGHVLPWLHAVPSALLSAGTCSVVTVPDSSWSVAAGTVLFSTGMIAFHWQWTATERIDRSILRAFAAALNWRRRNAFEREARSNASIRARNERELMSRLRQIERRFGVAVVAPAGPEPEAEAPQIRPALPPPALVPAE